MSSTEESFLARLYREPTSLGKIQEVSNSVGWHSTLLAINVHYSGVGNKSVEPPPLAPYRPKDGHLRVVVLHVAFNK